jgi:hypothetical protein
MGEAAERNTLILENVGSGHFALTRNVGKEWHKK